MAIRAKRNLVYGRTGVPLFAPRWQGGGGWERLRRADRDGAALLYRERRKRKRRWGQQQATSLPTAKATFMGRPFMVARRGLERRSSSLRVEERRCCTLLAAMGAYPSGVLIADSRGDLNGITSQGGGSGCFGSGYGVVFKLATPRVSSGAWTKTVLHAFGRQPRDGLVSWAGLIIDAKGNFYATWVGGASGNGCIQACTFLGRRAMDRDGTVQF